MRLEGLAKVASMKASGEQSSFLCFLPESQRTTANRVFANGMAGSGDTKDNSGKTVPMCLENRIGLDGTLDNALRFSDVSVEYDQHLCNGRLADHDLNNVTTGKESQYPETREIENEPITEHNGHDSLSDGSSGEVDVPAFEITEFFNVFKEGQESNFTKRKQMRDLLPPEFLLELEGMGSNHLILDQHRKSDKIVLRIGADPIDGRIRSGADRSGNWNCLSEPDSFSRNLSGALTFSGPMSFSGNTGHVSYSGSVSHRSDSSTASSHSFAFPTLPFEWNSSPVKMSHPEKRLVQRSWKHRVRSIICCANTFK